MSAVPSPPGVAADEVGRRIEAALEVLAGESAADVAARRGIEPELVERWCDLFVAGGCDRIAGKVEAPAASRDRFLALASHEFLTPLTIIRGWTETLLSAPDADEAIRRTALNAVSRAAVSLERIARDTLDAAAVALGRFRLVLQDVDVADLVRSAVADLGDPNVELGLLSSAPAVVDPARIEQVLFNLLTNAMQHGAEPPVIVGVARTPEFVTVTVRNRGAIEQRIAYELFEPWVRGEGSGGRGLGLYASRAVISAHGGHIGAKSDDEATEFWFRLPVEGPPAALLVERSDDLGAPTPNPNPDL